MTAYERALSGARAQLEQLPAPAPWFVVDAVVRWQDRGDGPRHDDRWRLTVASLASLAAAVVFAGDGWISIRLAAPIKSTLVVPVVALLACVVLVRRSGLGAQLLCRAIWWMYLLLAVVWSLAGPAAMPAGGSLVAVCTGFALLASGTAGLERRTAAHACEPVAFRGNVQLAMILALVDAHILGLTGGVRLDAGMPGIGPWALLLLSAALLAGTAGLARLRLWGVLLLVALALVLLPVLALGVLAVPPVFAGILGLGAAAQLILPLRMLWAIRRGVRQPERDQELPTRTGAAIVAALVLIAIVAGLVGSAAPL